MGSPPRGEGMGKENVFNQTSQDASPLTERGLPPRHDPQPTAPIEMTEINEHTSTEAPQKPQWPLDPISTEATKETHTSQPLKDSTPEIDPPSAATPTPAPLREPLAITSANAGMAPSSAIPHPLTREKTGPAIGPSIDKPAPNPQESDLIGFSLFITLLLISGARHPFKIDERYLKKRNVNVDGDNPVNMSIYTLKELIWREWRDGKYSTADREPMSVPFGHAEF